MYIFVVCLTLKTKKMFDLKIKISPTDYDLQLKLAARTIYSQVEVATLKMDLRLTKKINKMYALYVNK